MNAREGLRRIGIVGGIAGACVGLFISYVQIHELRIQKSLSDSFYSVYASPLVQKEVTFLKKERLPGGERLVHSQRTEATARIRARPAECSRSMGPLPLGRSDPRRRLGCPRRQHQSNLFRRQAGSRCHRARRWFPRFENGNTGIFCLPATVQFSHLRFSASVGFDEGVCMGRFRFYTEIDLTDSVELIL